MAEQLFFFLILRQTKLVHTMCTKKKIKQTDFLRDPQNKKVKQTVSITGWVLIILSIILNYGKVRLDIWLRLILFWMRVFILITFVNPCKNLFKRKCIKGRRIRDFSGGSWGYVMALLGSAE